MFQEKLQQNFFNLIKRSLLYHTHKRLNFVKLKVVCVVLHTQIFQVETGLVVYRAVGPEWRRFGTPMRKRPLTSVVLDDGVANSIVNDFKEFCSSSKWYFHNYSSLLVLFIRNFYDVQVIMVYSF